MLITRDFIWVVEFDPNVGDEVNCLVDYNKPYYKGWVKLFWDKSAAEQKALEFVQDVLLKSDLLNYVKKDIAANIQTVSAWNEAFRRFPVRVYEKEIS